MSDELRQPDVSPPKRRTIDKLHLVNFTAFKDLEIEFSPGINAIIGENATGKTHILKVLYIMISNPDYNSWDKEFSKYFFCSIHPSRWNLINIHSQNRNATIHVYVAGRRYDCRLGFRIPDGPIGRSDHEMIHQANINSLFIPVKEMLSHSKGFVETYKERLLYFEKQYADILEKAGVAPLRLSDDVSKAILSKLENALGGTINEENGVYFLISGDWQLEVSMVAEGLRKFGLLWLLVKNKLIAPGTVLFWDEPEANLNPKLIHETVQIILLMQRMGVQVFFATHDFVMLKWLDLLTEETDEVRYHALYRDKTEEIKCESKDTLVGIQNNAILDVYAELYDKDLDRAMQRLKHDDSK